MGIDKTAIRDAATVILLRHINDIPHVLMGQRGATAAFMPNKFVFPGGAVDQSDRDITLAAPISDPCRSRLAEGADDRLVHALGVACVRELWEETGLILGQKSKWHGQMPEDWHSYAATGHVPDAQALQFVFRAITPPNRPRRFDARFFLARADDVANDLDDFSGACDELSHLQWIALDEVRRLDMPFITEVVLAEVSARVADNSPPASVPFFKNDDEESLFLRIHGQAIL